MSASCEVAQQAGHGLARRAGRAPGRGCRRPRRRRPSPRASSAMASRRWAASATRSGSATSRSTRSPETCALRLSAGVGGDDLAVVDDDDPVAERVGLVEVVGREEDRGAARARAAPRMWVQRLARACGSRPVVGSSRKTRVGSWISPMTMSRRRRWPPDMVLGWRPHSPVEVELGEQLLAAACGPRPRTCRRASRGRRPRHRRGRTGRWRRSARRSRCCGAPARTPCTTSKPGDRRGARRGAQQRREHPQRRRLARAVGPEEADDLALGDVEVDAVDGAHLAPSSWPSRVWKVCTRPRAWIIPGSSPSRVQT